MFSNNKSSIVMWNCVVSMATRYAILKNGDVYKKFISQQQLTLEHLTLYQINSKTYLFNITGRTSKLSNLNI